MEPQSLTSEELYALLNTRIRLFASLSDARREQVLRLVQDQVSRKMPIEFILSSARSVVNEYAAEEEEALHPPDEERRRFIEAHALPPEERVSAKSQPRREAKAREREELALRVRDLLGEARSARQPHERKKMRRLLMGLDQARIRRTLGTEGEELCQQIAAILLQSTDLR
jgi:hypothetical protein